ncbi:hypothetical protein ACLB1O_27575 [Escherichia coli]
MKRGSQLLHKYDEQAAHPEKLPADFQLIGKADTGQMASLLVQKCALAQNSLLND